MKKIEVHTRLRPIRFGFLVRPDDKINLQRIFEINTCLWGGLFNPIIPYFERIPKWWSRHKYHFEEPKQILEGYLNFFEPDFIIETEKGLGSKLDLPEEIITHIDEFRFDDSYRGYRKIQGQEMHREIRGVNVFRLYKELYQKEFKFVRRHKHGIVHVNPKNHKYKLFTSCVFGCFPKNESLTYIERGYKDAFDPLQVDLDANKLVKIYKTGYESSLSIGCENIDVSYSNKTDPEIFILDISQTRDLIDFWNLRLCTKAIKAIPVQWLEQFSDYCENFIKENYRSLPGNTNGVMINPTFILSRSLSQDVIEKIKLLLRGDKKNGAAFSEYPNFWVKKPSIMVSPNRATLTAGESTQEIIVDGKGDFKFKTLAPTFVERYQGAFCWANVLQLKEEMYENEIATIFPESMRNPAFPKLNFRNERILSNREGLIFYEENKNWDAYFSILDGTTTFMEWLKTKYVKAEISDAGKNLQQMMKSFKGFWNVHYISHPKIIKQLNAMAQKQVKNVDESQKVYYGRTIKHNELKKIINDSIEDDAISKTWKKKTLESLIQHNVVKVGLEVKCGECDHRNWYSVDSLRYDLVCENCLKTFSFPQDNISSRTVDWSYRVIGPFTKPDYAQGAYTSALALRFFNDLDRVFHSSITWSTSLNLTFESDLKSEADFLIWFKRKYGNENHYGVDLIFGESKSYAKESFDNNDLKNLKNLAQKFPGSILVCATMKEELDKKEKQIISKLALWGREDTLEGATRAPLIVLTATELFPSAFGFRHTWEQKGGKHAQLIPAHIQEDNLRVIADLTQQVYLDLPSYHTWRGDKWKKKAEKKLKRKSETGSKESQGEALKGS